jgi:hypothetical protein
MMSASYQYGPERTHPDRERRQIIEEKAIEVIVRDRDDDVGTRIGEHVGDVAERCIELVHVRGRGLIAIPKDARIVRRRDDRYDLCHAAPYECSL